MRNLRDLDFAAKHLSYEIQPRIGRAIDEVTDSWMKKNRWHGKCSWHEKGLAVGPLDWTSNVDDEEKWFCFFELGAGQGDFWGVEHDYFWLTRFCGAGTGTLCFRWQYGKALGANKTKWRKFIQPHVEHIRKTGFEYEEESGLFFIPVRVEAEILAAAIEEDNIEEALEPFLRTTLDRLLSAKPEFDVMLDSAKKHFSV